MKAGVKAGKSGLLKRAAVVIAAVCAAQLLCWLVPRMASARGRFHEGPWREAVGILEEEVGAKAVRKGVFSIPKDAVGAPYSGECFIRAKVPALFHADPGETSVWENRSNTCTLFLGISPRGGRILYSVGVCNEDCRKWRRRQVAVLDRETARRIWLTFAYLDRVTSSPAGAPEVGTQGLCEYFDLWDRTLEGRPAGEKQVRRSRRPTLVEWVRDSCIRRYVGKLTGRADLPWSRHAGHAIRIEREFIQSSLPPLCLADQCRLESLVTDYMVLAKAQALPLVRRVRAASRPDWLCRIGRSWPLVGRTLRSRADAIDRYGCNGSLEEEIAFLERLQAVAPVERARFLAAEALGPTDDSSESLRPSIRALSYLAARAPRKARKLIIENFLSYGSLGRHMCSAVVHAFFPCDVELMRCLSRNPDKPIRTEELVHLYSLTGETELLEELPYVIGLGGWGIRPWSFAAVMKRLGELCLTDTQVCAFVRRHFGKLVQAELQVHEMSGTPRTIGDWPVLGALARAGGRDNLEFLSSVIDGDIEIDEYLRDVIHVYAYRAVSALGDSDEGLAAEILLDRLEGQAAADDITLWYTIVAALGRIGRASALPALERERKRLAEEAGPLAEPPADEEKKARSRLDRALQAIRAIELANSADPAGDFLRLDGAERELVKPMLSEILARCRKRHELEDLLADERCRPVLGEIYTALEMRREMEGPPGEL